MLLHASYSPLDVIHLSNSQSLTYLTLQLISAWNLTATLKSHIFIVIPITKS